MIASLIKHATKEGLSFSIYYFHRVMYNLCIVYDKHFLLVLWSTC